MSHGIEECMHRLRKDLRNMLAIIAEHREVLKIERGSLLDKEIIAARKTMIETQGESSDTALPSL